MDALLLIVAALYFIPTLVAVNRKHNSTGAIFLVNLLLGWSFLGWVLALVWAASHFDDPRRKVHFVKDQYMTEAEMNRAYRRQTRQGTETLRDRIWKKSIT